MQRQSGRTVTLLLTVALLVPAVAEAQSPQTTSASPGGSLASPGGITSGLVARLPATVADAPVVVAFTEDLRTWIDEASGSEVHPESLTLEAALADAGLSTSDVTTLVASVGADGDGQIQGFQLPDVDASVLRDPLMAVYFLGFGVLQRTQQTIAERPVLMVSEGPLETASYPSAILVDGDTLWIATAEEPLLHQSIEALVGVASGLATGNTGAAPADPMDQAPDAWQGRMRETLTWDREGYVGAWTVTFQGSWVRPVLNDIAHCAPGACTVYIPAGTIDWTWVSSTPTTPRCEEQTSGSLPTGRVVTAQDQMLFLAPDGPDHYRYWGSGTTFGPAQKCFGWDMGTAPGGFFILGAADVDGPRADVAPPTRPDCSSLVWRIPRDAASMSGTCWTQDYPGYEGKVEWDLRRVEGP